MTRLRLCWLILCGRPVAYRLRVDGKLLMPPDEVQPVASSIYPRAQPPDPVDMDALVFTNEPVTVRRVALVLLVDVHGDDVQDAQNWAETALRRSLGGERLGLPAPLEVPEARRGAGVSVVAVDIQSPRGAIQSGALDVVTRQPAQNS